MGESAMPSVSGVADHPFENKNDHFANNSKSGTPTDEYYVEKINNSSLESLNVSSNVNVLSFSDSELSIIESNEFFENNSIANDSFNLSFSSIAESPSQKFLAKNTFNDISDLSSSPRLLGKNSSINLSENSLPKTNLSYEVKVLNNTNDDFSDDSLDFNNRVLTIEKKSLHKNHRKHNESISERSFNLSNDDFEACEKIAIISQKSMNIHDYETPRRWTSVKWINQ